MRPFHHGDGSGDSGNWLQRVNDSEAGVLSASILHSVGALFFAGGIALYLYIAHSVRRASREGGPTNVGLLSYAHAFTLGGIALNGVGGVMRLYQSDHPGIERLGDSLWVQVLVVKHLFLIAGVGLAVWLAWRTRHLTRSPERTPQLEGESSKMAWYAAASLSTILLAAILGAAAGNVDLAADLGDAPALETPGMDAHAAHGEPESLAEVETSGTITGAPGRPGAVNHQFTVPDGADRMTIVLTWTTPVAQGLSPVEMGLELEGPDGGAAEGEETRIDRSLTVVLPPDQVRAGRWTATVTAERAVQESYRLNVAMVRSNGQGNVINRTITVPAGGEFFEANLLMQAGKTISYEWSILNSTTRKVHFDVHVHEGEDVRYAVNEDLNRHRANYTHEGVSQGPSLLWENAGSEPVQIRFRITGDFSLHSYVPA